MTPARVIGAGLSGLAAAWHLADRGLAVTVIEQASQPGGLIRTRHTEHGIVETGANAFVSDDRVVAWFRRLDLHPINPMPSSRRRYIYRDGRPRRWPLSVTESVSCAARLAAAALTRSMPARAGETIADWGDRVAGAAATRWLLEPAMQGIYATPADQLSARAIFDGRKKGPRQLVSPHAGMGQFVASLYQHLHDRGVVFQFDQKAERIEDRIPTVVCTPAAAAARLIAPHAPRVSQAIAAVRTAPLTTVTMFFAPHPDDVRGFGILFPAGAGVAALGVLYNTEIFAGRGPARSETWIVGDRQTGMTAWDDSRLLAALARDRAAVTGRTVPPLSTHITRWPHAIPVYDDAILGVAAALESLPPWLGVSGNYLGRIGVAALLQQAEAAAARIVLPCKGLQV
jgi:oxygen-dependent protoporphyrinogen oxidase